MIVPALAEPRTTAPEWGWLDAGLAIARRSEGLTFIALPAPVVPAANVVARAGSAGPCSF